MVRTSGNGTRFYVSGDLGVDGRVNLMVSIPEGQHDTVWTMADWFMSAAWFNCGTVHNGFSTGPTRNGRLAATFKGVEAHAIPSLVRFLDC